MSEENPSPEAEEQETPTAQDTPDPTASPETAEAPVAGLSNDDKNMAMLAHLLGIFTSFVGPLVIWLIKKDESKFVESEGREALNFQIMVMIVYAALLPVSFITCGLGSLLYMPVLVAALIFGIMGTVKAKDGFEYRYPINLRLIK